MHQHNDTGNSVVMVTGGAGYTGSILSSKLVHAGYKVVCVDCLRYGGNSLLGIWNEPNFVFERVDITDYKEVDNLFKCYKVYAIAHLAGIVGDPACDLEPDLAKRTNLDASVNLIEEATKTGVRRFIFASTCSNYGYMNDAGQYVDENSPLAPISLYAKLKVEVEDIMLQAINKKTSLCPTVLRFSTIYGISPRMRFDLTVNEFTKTLALDRDLQVYGEKLWRPYCHVKDYSQAVMKIMTAPEDKVAYEVFNVGDNSQNYTKQMLIDEIKKQIPGGKVAYVKKDEDPRNYRVDFTKIKRVVDFNISKHVPDGIKEILMGIREGVIGDPDNPMYYNTPV